MVEINILNEITKILGKLKNNKDLTQSDRNVLYRFFQNYIKKDIILDEVLKDIGQDDYNYLVEFVRKQNHDYYSFKRMCDFGVDAIKEIFINCVLINDFEIGLEFGKNFGDKVVSDVTELLNNIVLFCVKNNYPTRAAFNVLIDYYDSPELIAKTIASLINEHLDTLKINFIIRSLNNLKKR